MTYLSIRKASLLVDTSLPLVRMVTSLSVNEDQKKPPRLTIVLTSSLSISHTYNLVFCAQFRGREGFIAETSVTTRMGPKQWFYWIDKRWGSREWSRCFNDLDRLSLAAAGGVDSVSARMTQCGAEFEPCVLSETFCG